jgi:hypothetical protein
VKTSIVLAPKNSLVLVMDSSVGEVPESMGDAGIAATTSCVAVGTLAEMDGETEIVLADYGDAEGVGSMVFDGLLPTPSLELSVCDVDDVKRLSIGVQQDSVRVRIFTNDANEPDRVIVLVN